MDRINTLKRPEVLRELQKYKLGKTQKEIATLGGIAELRKELLRLETKKLKLDLNQPLVTENLNQDHLYNIMLNADYETLKSLCLTNRFSEKTCRRKTFWLEKFNHQGWEAQGDTLDELKSEYVIMESAVNTTKKILQLVDNIRSNLKITFNLPYDLYEDLINLIPLKLKRPTEDEDIEIIIQYRARFNEFRLGYIIKLRNKERYNVNDIINVDTMKAIMYYCLDSENTVSIELEP